MVCGFTKRPSCRAGLVATLVMVLIWLSAEMCSALTVEAASRTLQRDMWDESTLFYDFMDSPVCTIDRISAHQLSSADFAALYLERQPVIIRNASSRVLNAAVRKSLQKKALLASHGDDMITLSTGNRDSYAKKNIRFAEYVDAYMTPQPLTRKGNETWYHFGDPHHLNWEEVQQLYQPPWEFMHGMTPALSFGVASSGTGVPFHVHGHVFAEVLYGRKRWWITPPHYEPRFDPDESSLQWLHNVRPTYTPEETALMQECVCNVGDIIYIPTNWYHATLNLGESVFMSVFV